MIRTPMLVRVVAILAPLAITISACTSNSPATQLTLSTTTKTDSGSGGSTLVTGGSIAISSAQVVLSDVRLAVAGTPCAAETEAGDALRMSADGHGMDNDSTHDDGDDESGEDHDGDHRGCQTVQAGPLTVNLPLDASTTLVLDALVPAGTYTGVHAKLESVHVAGTFTDTASVAHPFTFALSGKAVIEIKLPTPVTIGPTTSNVTVMVDVASWFKTASGAVLDPTNQANAGAINRNIRRSFRAFADRDHDGEDDDHDEHDGDRDHHDSTKTTPI